ncbi:hypothetical protein [Flavobacterium polysaccharolyticum]|uniref:Lipoprotein n=1 Tax=Flavobacterium polysaccharolyticum TaxID=3133148 RepID=A0ABU9NNL3_9FLAO
MKKLAYLFCTLMLLSCSVSIQSTFENPKKPLTIEDKVALLDTHHSVPKDAEKIGSAHFQDSGFSTDCDFNSNLIKARKLAREKGANVVKVTEKKVPDLWSTCYRIKVDFYYTTSDINNIPQYKLQIN